MAGLTTNDDWTFGRGLASYKSRSDEVHQNIKTRLRSFKNDWFLDTDKEIDWLFLLGNRQTQDRIEAEVLRVTLTTFGVARVDKITVELVNSSRELNISLRVFTIYEDLIDILDFGVRL